MISMIKKHKWTLLLTSIITLSPILFGIIFWNQLPQEMPTHFSGAGNVADGYSSKPVAVFGLPVFLLIMEWFCVFVTALDPKRKNISDKMIRIVLWIVPVISLAVAVSIYGTALGRNIDVGMQMNILIGILFIVLGNYLHKVKQNHSVGLRIPWTLNNEDNWNRTHRFSAWIFILAGIALCINGYFKSMVALGVIIVVMMVMPILYSYILYKKELRN